MLAAEDNPVNKTLTPCPLEKTGFRPLDIANDGFLAEQAMAPDRWIPRP
jgi:hypothetical protein